ncbi:uncharacterized protein LOC111375899 [Olea europaea var. sylvestris]|uniref:uncharacterized protein LOC111375899 n=1 Tax=Olea europaea var. sylvestris TaxID=158386 RepID=UPI000C1D243B|nr:uncharacterized protein LOC111375899 [Olea europaea var. sylvestris]
MVEKSAPTSTENEESVEISTTKAPSLVKAYMPLIHFPQRLKKNRQDINYENFLTILKELQINIPFIDVILEFPSYARFLKKMFTKKRKFLEFETVPLAKESNARVQNKSPPKLKDLGSFTLPISIGNSSSVNALCDIGASINPLPCGKVESVLIKVGNLIFPADFIVMDIPEDRDILVILGWSFLATGRTLIDMEKGELILRVEDKQEIVNIYTYYKLHPNIRSCCRFD